MKVNCRWMLVISFIILFQTMDSPLAYSQNSDTTFKLLQELEALEKSSILISKPHSQTIENTPIIMPQKKIAAPSVGTKKFIQKKPEAVIAKRQYAPSPEILWKNRRNAEFYWNKGLDHWSTGDFQSAIVQFRRAMQNQPQNPHGHWNLSSLYNRIGDGTMAIYHMNIAHKIYLNDHNREEAARSKNKLRKLMRKYGINENNMQGSR